MMVNMFSMMDDAYFKERAADIKDVGQRLLCNVLGLKVPDLTAIDEEVIRLIGYDDLKATLPKMPMTIGKLTRRQSLRREIRDVLANSGLHEVVSYTLGDEAMVEDELLPIGDAICLSSPLNDARKYIRVGLFNSLCDTLAYNLAHSNRDVSLFEISTLYAKEGVMKEHLAVILNGDLQSSKVLHTSI